MCPALREENDLYMATSTKKKSAKSVPATTKTVTKPKIAAKKAKLDKYKIVELPKQKDILEELMKDVSDDIETKMLKKELGSNYDYYKHFKEMINLKGVQARMPYEVVLY